jgi:hypothetical protein
VKPRIQDVIETIMANVGTALSDAAVPSFGQIVAGQPIGTALVQIMGQATEQGLISVFPRPGTAKNVTRYPIGTQIVLSSNPNVPLIATLTPSGGQWTIAFTGSVAAGINVHTFVGPPLVDAFFQTATGDTLTSVATKTAAAINALAGTAAATASTNSVIVTGSPLLICNLGETVGTIARLVSRIAQTMQVSIWVPDPHATPPAIPAPLRFLIADAIASSIGTSEARFLALSDGTPMDIDYATEFLDDQAQSDYSLYAYHLAFRVEYDVLRYVTATTIGSVKATIAQNTASPLTIYSGGS